MIIKKNKTKKIMNTEISYIFWNKIGFLSMSKPKFLFSGYRLKAESITDDWISTNIIIISKNSDLYLFLLMILKLISVFNMVW